MTLAGVFTRLPRLTQRLLAVCVCVHFVRISATHPRKLWIATEHYSSTFSWKCGGSVEQRSPKVQARPEKHNDEEYAQRFRELLCESVDRQVPQNSRTEIGRDVSRSAAKESGVLGRTDT